MIVITSPSLNPEINISGVSSVTQLIVSTSNSNQYIHFEVGKSDQEHSQVKRVLRTLFMYFRWFALMLRLPSKSLIHYNFPLSNLSILRDTPLIFFAYILRHRVLLHIHGGAYLFNPKAPKFISFVLNFILTKKIPLIVLSEKEKKEIFKRYKCPEIHVLPNCVYANKDLSIGREDNSIIRLLFLGRIAKDKGIEHILQAVKMLMNTEVAFELHFAGEEETLGIIDRFRKELGSHFFYHGVVSGNRKDILLSQMDVFLLPSFYEGLPMSLLEAMAAGLTPVVTNVGSIDSVVVNDVNGLFVKPKSEIDIYNAILYLYNHRDRLKLFSQEAHNTILTKFSIETYQSKLNEIYEKI